MCVVIVDSSRSSYIFYVFQLEQSSLNAPTREETRLGHGFVVELTELPIPRRSRLFGEELSEFCRTVW